MSHRSDQQRNRIYGLKTAMTSATPVESIRLSRGYTAEIKSTWRNISLHEENNASTKSLYKTAGGCFGHELLPEIHRYIVSFT